MLIINVSISDVCSSVRYTNENEIHRLRNTFIFNQKILQKRLQFPQTNIIQHNPKSELTYNHQPFQPPQRTYEQTQSVPHPLRSFYSAEGDFAGSGSLGVPVPFISQIIQPVQPIQYHSQQNYQEYTTDSFVRRPPSQLQYLAGSPNRAGFDHNNIIPQFTSY